MGPLSKRPLSSSSTSHSTKRFDPRPTNMSKLCKRCEVERDLSEFDQFKNGKYKLTCRNCLHTRGRARPVTPPNPNAQEDDDYDADFEAQARFGRASQRETANARVLLYFPVYKSSPDHPQYESYCQVRWTLHHPFRDSPKLAQGILADYNSWQAAFAACCSGSCPVIGGPHTLKRDYYSVQLPTPPGR